MIIKTRQVFLQAYKVTNHNDEIPLWLLGKERRVYVTTNKKLIIDDISVERGNHIVLNHEDKLEIFTEQQFAKQFRVSSSVEQNKNVMFLSGKRGSGRDTVLDEIVRGVGNKCEWVDYATSLQFVLLRNKADKNDVKAYDPNSYPERPKGKNHGVNYIIFNNYQYWTPKQKQLCLEAAMDKMNHDTRLVIVEDIE